MVDSGSILIDSNSSVTAVSGTFPSTVQYFECLRLCQSFGKDFENSQVRLEAAFPSKFLVCSYLIFRMNCKILQTYLYISRLDPWSQAPATG
jgi:hypothetical protein